MNANRSVRLPSGEIWSATVAGTGRAIVLLHGYPLDRRLWNDVVADLVTQHTVIAPDFPGFGDSPASLIYGTMPELADGVADLLVSLNQTEPVILCGLSMGGYVALEFWRRHRQRLAGLIFSDSRVVSDGDETRQNRLRVAETVHRVGVQPIIDSMLPKLLAESTRRNRPEIVTTVTAMMRSASPAGIAAVQTGMAQRADFTDQLSLFHLPVLCIAGTEDVISTPQEMRAIADHLPNGEFAEISEAGHLPPIEQPKEFLAVVNRFLMSMG